ncbi:hypothetical protein DSECCO2_508190 [anaerobic digester metagenome]
MQFTLQRILTVTTPYTSMTLLDGSTASAMLRIHPPGLPIFSQPKKTRLSMLSVSIPRTREPGMMSIFILIRSPVL